MMRLPPDGDVMVVAIETKQWGCLVTQPVSAQTIMFLAEVRQPQFESNLPSSVYTLQRK